MNRTTDNWDTTNSETEYWKNEYNRLRQWADQAQANHYNYVDEVLRSTVQQFADSEAHLADYFCDIIEEMRLEPERYPKTRRVLIAGLRQVIQAQEIAVAKLEGTYQPGSVRETSVGVAIGPKRYPTVPIPTGQNPLPAS